MGATILALYVNTIAPTAQFWDASEYITAAKVLGIPHPPGNPLFVILANVWGQIPMVGHYALRINLFSAVCSALSSVFLFLVAERLLREMVTSKWQRYITAFAGVLVGASSFTVWSQSTVNEKVYTLSLFSISFVLWLTVRWADTEPGNRRNKLFLLIVYLLALTATNHLMGLLVIPAIVTYALWDRQLLPDWRLALYATAVTAAGLSLWLFLIVRAPLFPPINEGEPTTWGALWDVISRKQYAKPPLTDRQAAFTSQLANYWQYFTWQFGFDWSQRLRVALASLFGLVGLLGVARLFRVKRSAAIAQISLMATVSIVLVFYLNFKYGYSIRPEESLIREVRERDYFFLASFQLWGLWVALGLGAVVSWLTPLLEKRLSGTVASNAALAVLVVCLIPMTGNRRSASRSHETLARDFAVDLLHSLEPYAILITAGDNDQFPLWYAQEVEGIRRDVVTANLSLMNTTWHLKQIQRRPIYPFDRESALPIYQSQHWPTPSETVLHFAGLDLDSLPGGYRVEALSRVDIGEVRVMVRPGLMTRADIATLQLISENLGRRPIYFSRSTGQYADDRGLERYLSGQGLARKLEPRAIEASDSMVYSPALGWVNFPRTRELLFSAYHAESAARIRPRGWVDRPSNSILAGYAFLYAGFADMLMSDAGGESPDSTAMRLAALAQDYAQRMLYNIQYER